MFTTGFDFLDQLFGTSNTGLGFKGILNNEVARKWDSLSLDFSVSSLIDQSGNCLSIWESVSDPWLNNSEHVHGSLVVSKENSVVNLQQSQKSKDLLWLW
jgi:hypothetical protein